MIEALRRLGDNESFDTLCKVMQLPEGEQELVARALADLATRKHYDVADALSKHLSLYVREQGIRALRRLAAQLCQLDGKLHVLEHQRAQIATGFERKSIVLR